MNKDFFDISLQVQSIFAVYRKYRQMGLFVKVYKRLSAGVFGPYTTVSGTPFQEVHILHCDGDSRPRHRKPTLGVF